MIKNKIDAMLFDFDGTLADTSQDMVNCLNILLKKKSQVSANITEAKNFISKGAGGLIDFSMPNLEKEERNIYIKEYRKIIGGLMNRLREQDSEECKKIHNECHNSSIYQYYYLGSDSVQDT